MKIVECLSCGSTMPLSHSDGMQCCEHCETIFPVPDSVLAAEVGGFTPPHILGGDFVPRAVIRGLVDPAPTYNLSAAVEHRRNSPVFVDYLSFTLPDHLIPGFGHERCRQMAGLLVGSLPEFEFEESEKGLYGYTHSGSILVGGTLVGRIATGGNSGTIFIELTGKGTYFIDAPSWADWLDRIGARLSRIDLAHDDYLGSHTVHDVRDAYKRGEFKNRGQNPSCSLAGSWDNPDKWSEGLTYYVGKRDSGRMLRAYDKGKEQGDPTSPWVRFEVEFRRQRERPLVTDMLRRPAEYYKGAYAWLAWVDESVPVVLDRVHLAAKITYEALIGYAKTAYGKLINVMEEVCGSADEIIDLLRVDGIPRRLESASVPVG